MSLITAKHSYNAGDLITILPGLKKVSEETGRKVLLYQRLDLPADYGHNDDHPVKTDGRHVCMNKAMFEMMKPLIVQQSYIERFEIWQGEKVDFDFDLTRHSAQMPLPGGSIHKWPSLIFPQLECDPSEPWISIPSKIPTKQWIADYYGIGSDSFFVINRTARYQNPYIDYHFIKDYQRHVLFIGTKSEGVAFGKQWGVKIPYAEPRSFYEAALIIHHSNFFIGNQSACWHIADGMKVPRVLEVCAQYPNTFPTGKDGYSFVTQGALEYFFHKLLNITNA